MPLLIQLLQLDNVEETVDLHLSAFHGYLNTEIGRAYLRKFFSWFSVASEAIALCAVDQSGHVVGYAVGAITSYRRALQRYLIPTTIVGITTHFWILANPAFRLMVMRYLGLRPTSKLVAPKLPRPAASLIGIGVSPDCRGRGIGAELIDEFEKLARLKGFRSLYLSVYANNIAARKLYQKAGWQPSAEPGEPTEAMYYTKLIC